MQYSGCSVSFTLEAEVKDGQPVPLLYLSSDL